MYQSSILDFCFRSRQQIRKAKKTLQPTITSAFAKVMKAQSLKVRRALGHFRKSPPVGVGQYLRRKKNIVFFLNKETETVKAFDIMSQKQVGVCEADHQEISHIDVSPSYQKQGIGSYMIKSLNRVSGQGLVAYCSLENRSRYALTDQGLRLIKSCIRKRILEPEQLIVGSGPNTPSNSYW